MATEKKVFLDYGGLICDYQFNRTTLFRAHEFVLDYINSQDNCKISLDRLAQTHDNIIQSYLRARNKDSSEWRMDKIMDLVLSNLELNGNVSISKISEIYKLNDHDVVPFSCTSQVLTKLAEKRKLGIISNLPHNSLISELKDFNLYNLFDTITISSEVGYRKPHPKIYLSALKKADAKPEESIFISHEEEEVAGAEKVGMRGILVKSLSEVIGAL